MSQGTYAIRPADITPADVEIFYHFTPSRSSIGNTMLQKLDPNEVLIKMDNPNKVQSNVTGTEIFWWYVYVKITCKCVRTKGFIP
jgi:hypothetical protein